MKYYFITYQGKNNRHGSISIWNEVINTSPMDFIKKVEDREYTYGQTYSNYVIINTCEITEEEFIKYKDQF